tara:strand:+ start:102 stop:269 length:168 start_codon:yes stop_codon:yes gene_type:complete
MAFWVFFCAWLFVYRRLFDAFALAATHLAEHDPSFKYLKFISVISDLSGLLKPKR